MTALDFETQTAFEKIIDTSIIARYDGPLLREWGGKKGDDLYYVPEDSDHIRELLMKIWGKDLTPEAIEAAFARLMGDGEYCEWPHAYCDEDEAERPLSDFYTEEDAAFDALDDLRRSEELRRLEEAYPFTPEDQEIWDELRRREAKADKAKRAAREATHEDKA
jgi:hypothetical protein